jgi:hypothetical protein
VLRDQVGPVPDRRRRPRAAARGGPLRGGGGDRGPSVADDEPVQGSVRVGHEDGLAVEGAGREVVVGGLEVVDQLRERQVGRRALLPLPLLLPAPALPVERGEVERAVPPSPRHRGEVDGPEPVGGARPLAQRDPERLAGVVERAADRPVGVLRDGEHERVRGLRGADDVVPELLALLF